MTTDILNFEVRFLLAKYGRRKVLEALARARDTTVEQLEQELRKWETARPAKKPRQGPSVEDRLETLRTCESAKLPLVRELGHLYEARLFLPSLRDAEDFLARNGEVQHPPKSRKEALPLVLNVLSALAEFQLKELLADCKRSSSESDYVLLARQIMGKEGVPQN
ncbi:MAG: hypothetical protein HY360_10785 [Verrucomicrobia bacterium]|nr:hypothetical protein [Verrucomicrobiota bacterium]